MTATQLAPYGDIFVDLLRSIMQAQAEVLLELRNVRLEDVPHSIINRHFSWLALAYEEGENRHLFDSIAGTSPIRTSALRQRGQITPDILRTLKERGGLNIGERDGGNGSGRSLGRFVQRSATRISRLVKASFVGLTESGIIDREGDDRSPSAPEDEYIPPEPSFCIRSPLSTLCEILTIPSMPSSRAYILLTMRNFLFETFDAFPSMTAEEGKASNIFTVSDLEVALSRVWTSLRTRYNSRGKDSLPPEGRTNVDGMLRHFLAASDVLWLRFPSVDRCHSYLVDGVLRPDDPRYEFVRSDHLDNDRIPELGQLVNELWGLPIPIRGAETLFRGGLKFSSGHGLVMSIHGGPGTGKTSLALAIGSVLAPFGINTLFITAEETAADLRAKAENLVSDEVRRLSFFPKRQREGWLTAERLDFDVVEEDVRDPLRGLEAALEGLAAALNSAPESRNGVPMAAKPCRAVVVLDGIHDVVMAVRQGDSDSGGYQTLLARLRHFILTCRKLRALVIVTAGEHWSGERALEYLVDVVLRVSLEAVAEYGRKPDRRITLAKARHQLSASGTHGLQIAGAKGVRFSPQISYQLDRKSLWRTRLPEMDAYKVVLSRALPQTDFDRLQSRDGRAWPGGLKFVPTDHGVKLFRGSNIFLNGEGSGGKAALALKIAISPSFGDGQTIKFEPEKVLIVSFLYPGEYYDNIKRELLKVRHIEYGTPTHKERPITKVIHLYPGNYLPDQLFNRIEWELESAELHGVPYTAMVIDGLHNVFLQFPEIENYKLFWPQLYSALRTRSITIISTHTTFVLEGTAEGEGYRLDDRRSEPLRHALVQKTDFRFEIDPVERRGAHYVSSLTSNIFRIRTVAAINQPIPKEDLYWSRDRLVLFEVAQRRLPLEQ